MSALDDLADLVDLVDLVVFALLRNLVVRLSMVVVADSDA